MTEINFDYAWEERLWEFASSINTAILGAICEVDEWLSSSSEYQDPGARINFRRMVWNDMVFILNTYREFLLGMDFTKKGQDKRLMARYDEARGKHYHRIVDGE